ncbi:unnamed protein product [Orchesella dallaii]|uniref:PDZ domain-containing protein n=1 Tax=Orchesella dallaii TaxID=48710 RepID=A0ABP1QVC6_9HEXA
MFPDVRKLDINGNIAVIFYTFLISHAVAIAIFAIEYLWVMIFYSTKNQVMSGSDVANHVPFSQSSILSPVALEAFQVNTNGPATDESDADREICEILHLQDEITKINIDVVDLGVGIVGGGDSHLESIAKAHGHGAAAKDGQLLSDEDLILVQDENFQTISHSTALAELRQAHETVILVNCDKALDNSISISKYYISQGLD